MGILQSLLGTTTAPAVPAPRLAGPLGNIEIVGEDGCSASADVTEPVHSLLARHSLPPYCDASRTCNAEEQP